MSEEVERLTAPVAPSGNWRVGGKVPLNVYENDRPMFQCHTPEDASRVVALLNREAAPVAQTYQEAKEQACEGCRNKHHYTSETWMRPPMHYYFAEGEANSRYMTCTAPTPEQFMEAQARRIRELEAAHEYFGHSAKDIADAAKARIEELTRAQNL